MSDQAARQEALDASRSFIVQAPAGSGKTELLIQRYLRLLSGVNEPEQIVAITFTRKAAAEMRTRVLDALMSAHEDADAASPHKLQTQQLARAALARDAERGWNLRADPQRMRIGTLDSFNTALAMHLPLLSGGAGGSEVRDDASTLYREAARRTVEAVWQDETKSKYRGVVLAELDFDTSSAEKLIAGLLAVREQWITWLLDVDMTIEQAAEAIAALHEFHTQELVALLDSATLEELTALTRHASEHGNDAARTATAGIDSSDASVRLAAIANLFLTKQGTFRRRFTKSEGFSREFAKQKARLEAVVEGIEGHTELEAALDAIRHLPERTQSPDDEAMLRAVVELLQRAAAELRIVFAQRRVVDFTELSLAARYALGRVDAPSELLLALDQRIQHILVDEFQDTSIAQSEMLELLTAGWTPDDGRTLFLVGDPMQSIYRFRNADMSLFIAARQFGVGDVKCEALDLTSNFRSAPTIVDWVNEAFVRCFPAHDDLMRGVAAFKRGEATRSAQTGDCVQAHALGSTELADEHARVLQIIGQERRDHPDSHIAILVRSRSHLAGFQTLLREHGWQARAVEIDAPFTSQLAQDLIGLARALTHFGDRLAWLAQLRAPWCGLQWLELEQLVGNDPGITVWEAMHDNARLQGLEPASRERLLGLRAVLARAIARRAELPFAFWLEETWRALGGPESLVEPCSEHELDELFGMFDQLAVDQDISDVAELEVFFRQPLKQPDTDEPGIDIMTIHRAKGLEFDCVILPGLARTPRAEDRRLVEWFDAFDSEGHRSRVVAPLRRASSRGVQWIRDRSRERGRAEVARLLYVATTRARRRLHLVWGLEPETDPAESTLLYPIWTLVQDAVIDESEAVAADDDTWILPLRRRSEPLAAPEALEDAPAAASTWDWTASTAANVGIVVHDWLQTLCEQRQERWTPARIDEYQHAFTEQLALLGVPENELDGAQRSVTQALHGVVADARGQWVIADHDEAISEVMLSSIVGGRVVHQRLDRTFVADGVRWIVDYKTSVSSDGNIDAFLDAEVERYRSQLERYAEFMAQQDSRPIRLGLYFPLLPAFRDWPAAISAGASAR